MAIDSKYVDISDIRSGIENSSFRDQFVNHFFKKVTAYSGDYKGNKTNQTTERIFHLNGQIQYYEKKTGVTIVTWWFVQHILVCYAYFLLKENLSPVDSYNVDQYADKISAVTDYAGNNIFTRAQIVNVLGIVSKYQSDDIIKWIYNPRNYVSGSVAPAPVPVPVAPSSYTPPVDYSPVPYLVEQKTNWTPYLIAGGVAGLFLIYLMSKKKR